jgi:3-phenylpropionate/trans-cinnamate dioxygenase ferredoxin reductase subunit
VSQGVVIVGAGQGGFQVAFSLRSEGYDGRITLIGDEPHLPYQRPPLSKDFMAGKQAIEKTLLRPAAYYLDQRIDLITNEAVREIDRAGRSAILASGSRVPYDSLVLAVGARNRTLSLKGAQRDGVCYLRTIAEAVDIKDRLASASDIVVIGGGFIGLELAAVASSPGKSVTVLEVQPRLMPRAVAPILSDFYREVHMGQGVAIALGAGASEIRGREVVLGNGTILPADVVLVGVGVVANTDLAERAGLLVANGIVVDEYLRTGDENIYAIGDCAYYPNRFAGGHTRLESVQNAVDQARCVAAAIVGRPARYHAVPWFWTDQFDIKLQTAGLSTGADRIVTRGDPASRKFSVFYFKDNRLIAVDSINRPGEHIVARKLLAAGISPSPEQAADLSVDLKTLERPAPL